MTTVFIGASRAVSKLNALIRKGCQILIGDANAWRIAPTPR